MLQQQGKANPEHGFSAGLAEQTAVYQKWLSLSLVHLPQLEPVSWGVPEAASSPGGGEKQEKGGGTGLRAVD